MLVVGTGLQDKVKRGSTENFTSVFLWAQFINVYDVAAMVGQLVDVDTKAKVDGKDCVGTCMQDQEKYAIVNIYDRVLGPG